VYAVCIVCRGTGEMQRSRCDAKKAACSFIVVFQVRGTIGRNYFLVSFFLGWRIPNLITGLSGW